MTALYLIPPVLTSKSEPPPLFDGTTRLYICLTCPYAQRVWTARNIKGLSEVQIVPIDLQDKPAWYKDKVYPPNKVPSMEHNGKVIGERLDLLQYLENNFEGPKLFPTDPAKKEAADELLKYVDTFTNTIFTALAKPEPESAQEAGKNNFSSSDLLHFNKISYLQRNINALPIMAVPALDYLENALGKFADGPFLLGQFSGVDIAYGTFVERYKVVFPAFKNYDITADKPKVLNWIQELNKFEGYAKTVPGPEKIVEADKKILVDRL